MLVWHTIGLWCGYHQLLSVKLVVRIWIRRKGFENCEVWPERDKLKVVDKEDVVDKEIYATKMEHST